MQSLIERFYEDVDANLDDPNTSKRITKAKKLRLLHVAEKMIWERILMLSGQESIVGRSESTITIVNDKEFYLLPGNFRQFLSFERRTDDDSNKITATLNSIPLYDVGPGVVILSEQRGMMIKQKPILDEEQDWTLVYQKGTVRLHHATAAGVTDKTLTGASPGPDGGEMILNDGYYNGSLLMVHDAKTGQEQTREIVGWDAANKVFHLRHAWTTLPTGTIGYEIRPTLPLDYDDIYAMDVAIRILGRRSRTRGRVGLKQDRKDLWEACKSYFLSNVSDRAPARLHPVNYNEVDPYD